ncbi:MAG: O-methyltransferase [Bacteroidales bacterium]
MENVDSRESYIINHCTSEDKILSDLHRQTYLKMLNPRMISGHYQGKLLELISHMINPGKVLEIGTFTGYSAICMARGLKKNGMLHTIEINDEIIEFTKDFIARAGMEEKIVLYTGDAIEIIPSLKGPYDLVFIDGEKSQYVDFYNLVLPIVRPGGFIIADNVLWGGKVYNSQNQKDESTSHLIEFNDMIQKDDRIENFLLPVRDGLMIIRKK